MSVWFILHRVKWNGGVPSLLALFICKPLIAIPKLLIFFFYVNSSGTSAGERKLMPTIKEELDRRQLLYSLLMPVMNL